MPEGFVKTTFTGDPAQLLAQMEKIDAKYRELEARTDKLAKANKSAAQTTQQGWDSTKSAMQEQLNYLGSIENKSQQVASAIAKLNQEQWGFVKSSISAQRNYMKNMEPVSGPYWEDRDAAALRTRVRTSQREHMSIEDQIGAQGGLPRGMLKEIDDIYVKQERSKKQMQENRVAARGLTDELIGMAGAYIGISEAINFVNTGLERQKSLKQESQSAVGDIAGLQAKVGINLDKGDAAVYSKRMSNLGRKYGIMPKTMGDISQSALSATGGQADRAARISEKAIQLGILTPDDINEFAAGVGGLMDAVPGITLNEATEMVVSAGRASKIESQGNVGEYIGKSVTGQLLNTDLKKVKPLAAADSAAAYTATFSRLLNDKEGRISAEASVRLSADLRDFFAEKLPEVPDPGDTESRIAWIQQNRPDLIPDLKKSLRGESSQKAAAESFIDAKPNTMKIFEEAKKTTSVSGNEANKLIGFLDHGTPEIIAERLKRKAEAGKAYDAADDVRGSLMATADDQMERFRTQYERENGIIGSMGTALDRVGTKWMRQPLSSDKGLIESQISQIEFGKGNLSAKGQAEANDVIAELRKVVAALEENKEAIVAQTEAMRIQFGGAMFDAMGVGGLRKDQLKRIKR